jgi:hypothetical protein
MDEVKTIKFIGGPLHGKRLQVADGTRYVVVPVDATKGLPRQCDRRLWHECVYERIKFSSAKQYMRLKSGYFVPIPIPDIGADVV